jgi:hypothetical protein
MTEMARGYLEFLYFVIIHVIRVTGKSQRSLLTNRAKQTSSTNLRLLNASQFKRGDTMLL